MCYKYVLFDLDGTLSDSADGITKSVAFALEKFGYHEKAENLKCFVGPPLVEMFREKYSMSEEDVNLAVKYFRERFSTKGILENAPYDGVEEMLDTLKRAGKQLILATSKPEQFAKEIVERYGFFGYFTFIGGACMNERDRIRKDEVIEYVLKECKIENADECIMVGDRYHDVEGAAKYGIKTVGVLYGYGSKEELSNAGAIHLCNSPSEVCCFILSEG